MGCSVDQSLSISVCSNKIILFLSSFFVSLHMLRVHLSLCSIYIATSIYRTGGALTSIVGSCITEELSEHTVVEDALQDTACIAVVRNICYSCWNYNISIVNSIW